MSILGWLVSPMVRPIVAFWFPARQGQLPGSHTSTNLLPGIELQSLQQDQLQLGAAHPDVQAGPRMIVKKVAG